MRANDLLLLLGFGLLAVTCASTQKPFDEMTALEHRAAATREHQLADEAFARITGDDIAPPEVLSTGYLYDHAAPAYDPYLYEVDDPEAYVTWPRVSDPSEKYEDAAREHRDNALRHERAAAALEGRPSPQPLPPDRT